MANRSASEAEAPKNRTVDAQAEWSVAHIGADFAPNLSLQWTLGDERPALSKGVAVEEDVMQTFLWLHAREITGEPITIFAKSGFYWGMADLMGVDPLGRIHIFELKKTKVHADVAGQLEQYLLGFVMQDVALLKEEWRPRQAELLGDGRDGLVIALAGAHATVRTDTRGRKAIAKSLAKVDPEAAKQIKRASFFSKVPTDEKVKHLVRVLLETACRKRRLSPELCPSLEQLRQQASELRPRLDATEALKKTYPRLKSPAVVWLVGPRVDESARQRVRAWRRAGLDARWLEFQVVARRRELGWDISVVREHAPQRAGAVGTAIAWLEQYPSDPHSVRLSTRFYLSRAPSIRDRGGRDLEGGRLLQTCCIAVEPLGVKEPIHLTATAPAPAATSHSIL